MNVGVYIDAHLGVGEAARAIEDAGFSNLWVYDSPLVFGDPWMAMVVAAQATERLVVAPGVTHPGARSPLALAQAMGTLATIAPGRVALGIGTGFSARRGLGMRAASQDELIEYLTALRGLLRQEGVAPPGDERSGSVRFAHPSGRWLDLTSGFDIWVSAFGPRGQGRAGEVADGIIVRWEGAEATAAARARFRAGAEGAGRDPEALRVAVLHAMYPIEDEREYDGAELRAALGPFVRSRLSYLITRHRHSSEVARPYRRGFDAYLEHRRGLPPGQRETESYRGYLTEIPAFLREAITPESIREVAFVAPTADVIAELLVMRAAGVDHVGLQIAGPPGRWIERMGRDVTPALR